MPGEIDDQEDKGWERWTCLVQVAHVFKIIEDQKRTSSSSSDNITTETNLPPLRDHIGFVTKRKRSPRTVNHIQKLSSSVKSSDVNPPADLEVQLCHGHHTVTTARRTDNFKSLLDTPPVTRAHHVISTSITELQEGGEQLCKKNNNITSIKKPAFTNYEHGESSKSSNYLERRKRIRTSVLDEDWGNHNDYDFIEERINKNKRVRSDDHGKPPRPIRSALQQQPVNLRQDFKDHIRSFRGGCDQEPVLVIDKSLFKTDVSSEHSRLSVPYSKIQNQFLEEVDVDELKGPNGEILATLVQPNLEECKISLRDWNSNNQYALVKTWNNVRKINGLTEGMRVQLWSFRRASKLCFALVPV